MNLQKKLKIFTLLKKLKKKNFFKTSLHNPKFYTNDKKALVKAIDDGWVSTKGPSIKLFEKLVFELKHGLSPSPGSN